MKKGELHNIRNSVNRQAPLGDEKWQVETATKYGMLSTLKMREGDLEKMCKSSLYSLLSRIDTIKAANMTPENLRKLFKVCKKI